MNRKAFDDFLLETLDDERLSRKETDVLNELLAQSQPDERKLAQYRNQAFEAAKKALGESKGAAILDWLEGVVKVLQSRTVEGIDSRPVTKDPHLSAEQGNGQGFLVPEEVTKESQWLIAKRLANEFKKLPDSLVIESGQPGDETITIRMTEKPISETEVLTPQEFLVQNQQHIKELEELKKQAEKEYQEYAERFGGSRDLQNPLHPADESCS
ncbi:MAG: hypothetical protein ACFCD0_27040 [Gemmataceae bacterium]